MHAVHDLVNLVQGDSERTNLRRANILDIGEIRVVPGNGDEPDFGRGQVSVSPEPPPAFLVSVGARKRLWKIAGDSPGECRLPGNGCDGGNPSEKCVFLDGSV